MSSDEALAGSGPVRVALDVDAPADRVWALVSDLPGMGRFSPENRGGRWVRGDGPHVGAVLVGRNARGLRRWSTRCRVVESVPGRSFAFEVSSLGLPVSDWRYDLEPTDTGCRVTETWTDRRGPLLRTLGVVVTGVGDRRAFVNESMTVTLRRVKAAAEGQNRDGE